MEYSEILLKVPKEIFEQVSDVLFDYGALGTELISEDSEILFKAYFKKKVKIPESLSKYIVSRKTLEEKDWNEEWKKYYKPVQVTEKIWIVPSWEKGKFKEPTNSIVVYIEPGRGFGTGTHETTQLVIELLEEFLKPGGSFLDVGTGSGILSIIAKKLGATEVVACDIQEGIEEEVRKNCSLNNVSGVKFIQGSVDRVLGRFSIVAANIEKHLLLPLLNEIYEKTEDRAIFSGILKSQREEFIEEVKRVGFKLETERSKGEWIAFLCRK